MTTSPGCTPFLVWPSRGGCSSWAWCFWFPFTPALVRSLHSLSPFSFRATTQRPFISCWGRASRSSSEWEERQVESKGHRPRIRFFLLPSRSALLPSRTLLNLSVSPASWPDVVASSLVDLEVRCVQGCVAKPIAIRRPALSQAREVVTAANASRRLHVHLKVVNHCCSF